MPRSRAAEPAPPKWGTRTLHAVFQPRRLLLLALLVSLPFWVPEAWEAIPDLSGNDEYLIPAAEITANEPPRWVPLDLVDQVVNRAQLPETLSLLDDGLTEEVAQAFLLHPWVADVVEVRKQPAPARITVQLEYRRPVCMVEKKTGLYPVDAEGILLPSSDFSLAETAHFLKVVGVRSTPLGPEGTSWGDPAVIGAARIAAFLHDKWDRLELRSIQPASAPDSAAAAAGLDDLNFVLVTRGGSSILWGRAPGVDRPGELAPAQKIGRLEKYLADFGSFDQPAGPYEIDIRHWQQISRRRLSASTEAGRPVRVRR